MMLRASQFKKPVSYGTVLNRSFDSHGRNDFVGLVKKEIRQNGSFTPGDAVASNYDNFGGLHYLVDGNYLEPLSVGGKTYPTEAERQQLEWERQRREKRDALNAEIERAWNEKQAELAAIAQKHEAEARRAALVHIAERAVAGESIEHLAATLGLSTSMLVLVLTKLAHDILVPSDDQGQMLEYMQEQPLAKKLRLARMANWGAPAT